ncbi:charged multivesicular body protein 3-like protein [Piptocephalis cylindrospora]|uniref:Charged multivesicular body protein 3-like protein n=1 Tax=Piptocephalis cylindrospora TaxID=1907219 RepID=A0A4P9Y755_9FUNG|nr:charged multivesicular body protein 3-like protein [Piptocephalis cylindrospora]|eukprot:RKP14652.1 charged multivesicular body protein 3-like protein [Piptocephalis cylindrospora]
MEAMQRLIFRTKTPEQMVREWKSSIRAQERTLDRELRALGLAEQKTKTAVKQLAKKNDIKGCRVLAKEIVRSKKHRERLTTSKAQLNSINLSLQHQLAMVKVSGTLSKSTDVMKAVNSLMRVPQISQQMQEMSYEMTKAGVMEEMMQDTLEGLDDAEDALEDEADEEVDRVLNEITAGKLHGAPALADGALPEQPDVAVEAPADPEMDDVQARLEALRN